MTTSTSIPPRIIQDHDDVLHVPSYELGVLAGVEIGRSQVEREVAAEWSLIREVTMPAALREPFDVLAERRGQHQRAEASRELLRSRGVVA